MLSFIRSAFKFEKMDPPGSWCSYQSIFEVVEKTQSKTFLEVGCGAGDLSKKLCHLGLTGVGVDFSEPAIAQARENLGEEVRAGKLELIHGDIRQMNHLDQRVDIGISLMVMEHVEDDVSFVKQISKAVRPGGHVLVAVPGRKDRWCFEDETVGHLRRYDRWDLEEVFRKAGISEVQVISVAVPVANFLFNIGNFLIRNSSEKDKTRVSLREQTETSGIREIPFKTVFPRIVRLILNRYTMTPFFWIQRMFYNTNLGLTQFAIGRVPAENDLVLFPCHDNSRTSERKTQSPSN